MSSIARCLIFAGVVAWPSLAAAYEPYADCSGWETNGYWGWYAYAESEIELQQQQEDGSWVVVGTDIDGQLGSGEAGGPLNLGALWDESLDGTFRVVSTTTVYSGMQSEPTSSDDLASWSDVYEFGPDTSASFVCVAPPPPSYIDGRTPGYWKNHEESWDVDTLEIAGADYSRACLLDVLDLPARGDARVKLLHHLIAAELNVAAGSDPSLISATIDDAHAALSGTTIDCGAIELSGSAPKGGARELAAAIKDTLDAYNNNDL